MAKIMHAEMEKKGEKIKTLSFLFPLFRDMNSVSVAKDTYQKFPNTVIMYQIWYADQLLCYDVHTVLHLLFSRLT
jgi:hypothetical protein